MDKYEWSIGGLNLLRRFEILIKQYGGEDKVADFIEGEWIKIPKNHRPKKITTWKRWTNTDIDQLIRMHRDGIKQKNIGLIMGRTRASISEKVCELRSRGGFTKIGEWEKS